MSITRRLLGAAIVAGAAAGLAMAPVGEARADTPRIAFLAPELDITQFFGQFYAEMTATLEAAGLDYERTEAAPPGGQRDIEALDNILGDMLSLEPDYLVLVLSHFDLVEPRLRELKAAGVNLILVEYLPEHTDVEPLAWIITDHYESGYITGYGAGQIMADRGLEHVNVASFHGTSGSEIGIERMKGYVDGFRDASEEHGFTFDIVEEVWTEFNREMAFNVSQDVAIKHPNLNLIFGANSNTSLGVMEGLRTVGALGNVEVTGIGGQLEELAGIVRGDILLAGVRLPRAQGRMAAEIILEHIEKGGAADIRRVNRGEQVVVHDPATVFEFFPIATLDEPEFRRNIPAAVWDEHASSSD
jgi:ABC-type sugar transport system substrate-binding protein